MYNGVYNVHGNLILKLNLIIIWCFLLLNKITYGYSLKMKLDDVASDLTN